MHRAGYNSATAVTAMLTICFASLLPAPGHGESVAEIGRRSLSFQIRTPSVCAIDMEYDGLYVILFYYGITSQFNEVFRLEICGHGPHGSHRIGYTKDLDSHPTVGIYQRL